MFRIFEFRTRIVDADRIGSLVTALDQNHTTDEVCINKVLPNKMKYKLDTLTFFILAKI